MGDYTIVVSGQGSHHNGQAGDADRLAQRFAEDLVEAGQTIRVAFINYGGLGVLDTITPAREAYHRYLEAQSARDPSKHPYGDIGAKLDEYDKGTFRKLQALSTVNLLPAPLGKTYHDQMVAAGLDVRYRWAPNQMRQRSVDGGETWQPAPEHGDIIPILQGVEPYLAGLVFADNDRTFTKDELVTLVAGNIRGIVGMIVDTLGIREQWENAASDPTPVELVRMPSGRTRGTIWTRSNADTRDVEQALEDAQVRTHGETRTRAHAAREDAQQGSTGAAAEA